MQLHFVQSSQSFDLGDLGNTFNGNPLGGSWYPHIFNSGIASDNPSRNEPLVQGAIVPFWNDRSANTSVYSVAYYVWREGIPALADKQWGGRLSQEQFKDVFPKFYPYIPAQDLERRISSKYSTIFKYDFSQQTSDSITDLSPNGYHGHTSCVSSGSSILITPNCSVASPLYTKGRDYTLTVELKIETLPDPVETTLVSGYDSVLLLTPNITFYASGNYYQLSSTIPLNTWVTLMSGASQLTRPGLNRQPSVLNLGPSHGLG